MYSRLVLKLFGPVCAYMGLQSRFIPNPKWLLTDNPSILLCKASTWSEYIEMLGFIIFDTLSSITRVSLLLLSNRCHSLRCVVPPRAHAPKTKSMWYLKKEGSKVQPNEGMISRGQKKEESRKYAREKHKKERKPPRLTPVDIQETTSANPITTSACFSFATTVGTTTIVGGALAIIIQPERSNNVDRTDLLPSHISNPSG